MKRRLKPKVKRFLIAFGIIIILFILILSLYKIFLAPVNKKGEEVEFIVNKGETFLTISNELKEQNLIRSKIAYKIYVKMKKVDGLHEGQYTLNKNMTIKQIVDILKKKSKKNPNAVIITFKEGINMRKIASLIEENTNHKKEEVFNLLKDQNYLNELINTYWFLTDDIKNPSIYYSLEGYLFPNTYEFSSKDVDLKEIFKKMLDNMEEKLEPYKTQIASSNYNIHQLLTLASIVELEAARSDDRNGVAGVFFNRLKAGWSLGSDVTTYYAIQIDMNERDLYQNELESYNAYNTRSSQMAGKLPVGPICIPSKESIDAAINPKSHNYFYFVADKNKKTYFSKTGTEHNNIVAKLKKEKLWYEY
ncbi:MAG: endolytic transglycosylase MltG [Bacilli bacterium]